LSSRREIGELKAVWHVGEIGAQVCLADSVLRAQGPFLPQQLVRGELEGFFVIIQVFTQF
jgi:hypothetical protein